MWNFVLFIFFANFRCGSYFCSVSFSYSTGNPYFYWKLLCIVVIVFSHTSLTRSTNRSSPRAEKKVQWPGWFLKRPPGSGSKSKSVPKISNFIAGCLQVSIANFLLHNNCMGFFFLWDVATLLDFGAVWQIIWPLVLLNSVHRVIELSNSTW